MSNLLPQYVCHCMAPRPHVHLGEDTGLCKACQGVYDENLYEMRLRQHVARWDYVDVNEYLLDKDPLYRAYSIQANRR